MLLLTRWRNVHEEKKCHEWKDFFQDHSAELKKNQPEKNWKFAL